MKIKLRSMLGADFYVRVLQEDDGYGVWVFMESVGVAYLAFGVPSMISPNEIKGLDMSGYFDNEKANLIALESE